MPLGVLTILMIDRVISISQWYEWPHVPWSINFGLEVGALATYVSSKRWTSRLVVPKPFHAARQMTYPLCAHFGFQQVASSSSRTVVASYTQHTTSGKLTSCYCKHVTHITNRDLDHFLTRQSLSTFSRIFRAPMPVQLAGGNLGKHFNAFSMCLNAVAGPS